MDNENKSINDRIAILAKKWQEGAITLEEKSEFEEWYHSFDDSLIELEEGEDIAFLKEHIFESVEKATDLPKARKSFLKLPFFRVAIAILVFSISLSLYLHHAFFREKEKVLTSVEDIKPGEQKAVLILSDGSRLELDGKSQEQVMTIEDAEIERKEGQLVYAVTKGRSMRYPVEFTGKSREVELSGEAYFEVAKDQML